MKNTKKIISILLAVIMSFSCIALVASAEEVDDYDTRVDGWNANYDLYLDYLFNDANYTSWNYVDINEKAMKDTMATWTAFALYDEAWRNYATHHISIEQAELILLAFLLRQQLIPQDILQRPGIVFYRLKYKTSAKAPFHSPSLLFGESY